MNTLSRIFNKYFLTAIVAFVFTMVFVMPMFGVDVGEWNKGSKIAVGFVFGMVASIWSDWMIAREKRQEEDRNSDS